MGQKKLKDSLIFLVIHGVLTVMNYLYVSLRLGQWLPLTRDALLMLFIISASFGTLFIIIHLSIGELNSLFKRLFFLGVLLVATILLEDTIQIYLSQFSLNHLGKVEIRDIEIVLESVGFRLRRYTSGAPAGKVLGYLQAQINIFFYLLISSVYFIKHRGNGSKKRISLPIGGFEKRLPQLRCHYPIPGKNGVLQCRVGPIPGYPCKYKYINLESIYSGTWEKGSGRELKCYFHKGKGLLFTVKESGKVLNIQSSIWIELD